MTHYPRHIPNTDTERYLIEQQDICRCYSRHHPDCDPIARIPGVFCICLDDPLLITRVCYLNSAAAKAIFTHIFTVAIQTHPGQYGIIFDFRGATRRDPNTQKLIDQLPIMGDSLLVCGVIYPSEPHVIHDVEMLIRAFRQAKIPIETGKTMASLRRYLRKQYFYFVGGDRYSK